MSRPNAQKNFKTLIRDELVTRFESVIVDEINIYKSGVNKTDCEIKQIRNLIDQILILLESEKKEQNNKDFRTKEEFKSLNKKLEYSHSEQNRKIYESAHEINLAKLSVETGLDRLSTKQEIVDFKENILKDLSGVKQFIVDKDRIYTNKLQKLFEKKDKIFHEFLFMYKHELEEFKKELDKLKKDLSINIVDAEGVTRSIKVDQKSIFVIEKKIENIYTIIDRMKKEVTNVSKRIN